MSKIHTEKINTPSPLGTHIHLPHTEPKENVKPNPATSTGTIGRVRLDTSMPLPSKPRSPLARLRYWYRNSLLRLHVLEGIACLHRMKCIRQIRAVEMGRGTVLTQSWMNRVRVPAAYTVPYTLHMQRMETLYLSLSIFDLFLLKESWMVGLEFGIHIGKSQNQVGSVPSANDTSAMGRDGAL